MSRFDDETLMRGLDGELDAETAKAVDAAATEDAAVAARLQGLRRADAASRAAFPATVDPRDADLTRLIAGAGAAKATRGLDWRAWLTPPAVGLGAGLAVAGFVAGVLIGPMTGDRSAGLVDADGRIASAGLVQVLDRRLAGDGPDAAGRAVGLTFEATDGRWCRTFNDGQAAMGGLACRDDDGWTVQALAPAETAGGELRTAGSELPTPVLAAVDALIAGETVSAADESKARDAGFR